MFLVDAARPQRLREARDELQGLLGDEVVRAADIPVAVLANKIDLPGAAGESDMLYGLGTGRVPVAKGTAGLGLCW